MIVPVSKKCKEGHGGVKKRYKQLSKLRYRKKVIILIKKEEEFTLL